MQGARRDGRGARRARGDGGVAARADQVGEVPDRVGRGSKSDGAAYAPQRGARPVIDRAVALDDVIARFAEDHVVTRAARDVVVAEAAQWGVTYLARNGGLVERIDHVLGPVRSRPDAVAVCAPSAVVQRLAGIGDRGAVHLRPGQRLEAWVGDRRRRHRIRIHVTAV